MNQGSDAGSDADDGDGNRAAASARLPEFGSPPADVRRRMDRRWSRLSEWPMARLLAAKAQGAGTSVSVVLPALNEQQTVGEIVACIRTRLMEEAPLVDEVLVIDSGSTDRTAEVAEAAGARLVHRDEILPSLPAVPGKREVLWRSLFVTSGDVVCFVDAGLRRFDAALVRGILGPLLNLHWPQLAGIVQPLAGEHAARRSLLERLPFPCGYGVELGLLVDSLGIAGLDALAQVDVGNRYHRHQADQVLGRMSSEICRPRCCASSAPDGGRRRAGAHRVHPVPPSGPPAHGECRSNHAGQLRRHLRMCNQGDQGGNEWPRR